MARIPNIPLRKHALRGTPRIRAESEFMEIVIDLHDIEAIKKMGTTWQEGIPGNYMQRVALATEVIFEQEMQNVATQVADTGRMAESVETHIDILGVQGVRISANYNVSYEEFVDTGTWPSLGRFIPGLVPRDTTYWNYLGARLSTLNAVTLAGTVWGWHPGTPARHIWVQVEERIDERIRELEQELVDKIRFWFDGVFLR